MLTNCALNYKVVYAQTSEAWAKDSVQVIMPKEVWENRSSQAYFAIPDSLARRALVKLMMRDTLSFLYLAEAEKVMELRESLSRERRERFYERGIIVCLILILMIK